MKIDRLYAITLYLLNHGRTSARTLADHFEVSVRTVQRDIDSLCLAGIPIISSAGSLGGYEISDYFKLDTQFATSADYSYILTALKGLISATGDQRAKSTLEKIACTVSKEEHEMILDFSVLREGDTRLLQALQTAITQRRTVTFTYTNSNQETRTHSVEPIAVVYRWYAWYLLAYSKIKEDYRTYKLIRMSNLEITTLPFTKCHAPADRILEQSSRKDSRRYITLYARCRKSAQSLVKEYLNGTVLEEYPDGDCFLKLTVVENEPFWFGMLMSLGDQIEIIEPESIRSRLKNAAGKIMTLYA